MSIRPAYIRQLSLVLLIGLSILEGAVFAQSKVGTTGAPFLAIGTGARALGMGDAFVAIANDVSALYWNPAGTARIGSREVMFSHTEWFVATRVTWLGVSVPLDQNNAVGVSVALLDYGEGEVTTVEFPEGTGERWSASDLALGISYARNLTDRFSVGGTAKFVQQKLWNERAAGFAFDVGVLFLAGVSGLRLGATVANFGTDMRLDGKDLFVQHDIDPENAGNNPAISAKLKVDAWSLPLLFRVGTAMDLLSTESSRLTVGIDALHPTDNTESINTGFEYSFRQALYFRAGYKGLFQKDSQDRYSVGVGLSQSVGGLRISIDYSYQEVKLLNAVQRFAVRLKF